MTLSKTDRGNYNRKKKSLPYIDIIEKKIVELYQLKVGAVG